jgi:hypothetical protein
VKTLEQLNAEAARYGRERTEVLSAAMSLHGVKSFADGVAPHVALEGTKRMIANALELAFKAGVNAARDGVQ